VSALVTVVKMRMYFAGAAFTTDDVAANIAVNESCDRMVDDELVGLEAIRLCDYTFVVRVTVVRCWYYVCSVRPWVYICEVEKRVSKCFHIGCL
jgi:hypothetical protein